MKKSLSIRQLLPTLLPCLIVSLFSTNLGQAWRFSQGTDPAGRILDFFRFGLGAAFENPLPSFYPFDLLIGFLIGGLLWLILLIRQKNARKFRPNTEYGSARWGTAKDIAPFMDPKFEKNILLTRTERLMLSNRPRDPADARNKNVLVIGGSGSGKTRFFIKPNLMQMHSSFVITDPKGYINYGQSKQ